MNNAKDAYSKSPLSIKNFPKHLIKLYRIPNSKTQSSKNHIENQPCTLLINLRVSLDKKHKETNTITSYVCQSYAMFLTDFSAKDKMLNLYLGNIYKPAKQP